MLWTWNLILSHIFFPIIENNINHHLPPNSFIRPSSKQLSKLIHPKLILNSSDLRTPPVQSKSFRILQKITDTVDDGNSDESGNQQRNDSYMDAEPQLQRPTFARQMSAQQARNSPTVEQMRRMKIGQEQGKRKTKKQSKEMWLGREGKRGI